MSHPRRSQYDIVTFPRALLCDVLGRLTSDGAHIYVFEDDF